MFHVFLYKLHYDICHNIIQYAVSFLPTLNQSFFASAVWLDEIQLLLPLTSVFNLKKVTDILYVMWCDIQGKTLDI